MQIEVVGSSKLPQGAAFNSGGSYNQGSTVPNLSARVLFELEEPIPTEGRAIVSSSSLSHVSTNATDSQVAIYIPSHKFYTVNSSLKTQASVYYRGGRSRVNYYWVWYPAVTRKYVTLNIDIGVEVSTNTFTEFVGILWNGISVPNSNVIKLGD